jgi:predicted Zn-dependent protease
LLTLRRTTYPDSEAMRTLGLPELLIILGLLALLMGGARISRLFDWLGRRVRNTANQVKWMYQSLGGTEEQEIQAEKDVGAELASRFLAQTPRDPDENVQDLINRVGARLAQTPQAGQRRFVFQVVQSPVANAYALPGGYVFITRSLVRLCDGDLDEAAFLLAHEMGHVLSRHMAERNVVDTLLGALRAGQVIGDLLGKGYSREQEREADLKAVELATKAGFDGQAALRVLRKLSAETPETGEFAQYFSTHPSTQERLEYVTELFR